MGARNSTNSKIVALLSDFGSKDAYVGIMKGVILAQDPEIRIVDLTHEIDPQNILSGAYLLYTAWHHFPPESAFCAVVDPGVGSQRGALFAEIDRRYLIAPDNGLISLLARMIPAWHAYTLRVDSLLELRSSADPRSRPSATFHGRDVFAPAAALYVAGFGEGLRGPKIEPVLLPDVVPEHGPDGITGRILHIDHFGNCISSVHRDDLLAIRSRSDSQLSVQAGEYGGRGIARTYADVPTGAPLCLIGGSGFLEIAVREGNAAKRFHITPGCSFSVA